MVDDSRSCCGGGVENDAEHGTESDDGHRAENDPVTERWRMGDSPLTTELPGELRSALGRFLGTEPVDTLGGWVAAVRHHGEGDALTIDELCASDEETEHWGIVDGDRYHFACFYDAVLLAAMVEDPVDVRTKSPDGSVIEARAVGTADLTVSPEEAAFSFGIDRDVAPPPGDGPRLEDGYAAICPYVKAFPDRDAYERWAETVRAATVGMPLAGATELAAALVK